MAQSRTSVLTQWSFCPGRSFTPTTVLCTTGADKANTASMNEHLAATGAAVAPGAHGVVVLDGAGWHRSGDLLVPPNLTLLHLPPYSPELNPMEQITFCS
ncbi:MAG: transposase [Alphaproteobacteria bacterium]|nr:transposase [Alphaproteobacteria bacterium]